LVLQVVLWARQAEELAVLSMVVLQDLWPVWPPPRWLVRLDAMVLTQLTRLIQIRRDVRPVPVILPARLGTSIIPLIPMGLMMHMYTYIDEIKTQQPASVFGTRLLTLRRRPRRVQFRCPVVQIFEGMMATYSNGTKMRVGDEVQFRDWRGVIAFVMEPEEFSAKYPRKDWIYLKDEGVLFGIATNDNDFVTGKSTDELIRINK
jgi:hypothetical protein